MACAARRSCGHKEYTFGEGGVQRTAAEYGLKVLAQVSLVQDARERPAACCPLPLAVQPGFACARAQVPLDIGVRVQADAGAPIVVSHPEHPCAAAYAQLARNVLEALRELEQQGQQQGHGGGPAISVEH